MLTAEQIVERMVQMDAWRTATLQSYTVMRRYVLDNNRFHKHAEMEVRMKYTYPGRKKFEVISEKGSGAVRKRVFRRMIEAEIEGAQDQARNQTRIIPANYEFRLVGTEVEDGQPCYVLEANPKTDNTLLFRGKVWVDAKDFAVVRIEGSPAKNPSFWTRKIHFVHRYQKVGPFWLPASNRSKTDVLIFGPTELVVEYLDYRVNQPDPSNESRRQEQAESAASRLQERQR
jgi:outer membrane lipoprotein-sorting protein